MVENPSLTNIPNASKYINDMEGSRKHQHNQTCRLHCLKIFVICVSIISALSAFPTYFIWWECWNYQLSRNNQSPKIRKLGSLFSRELEREMVKYYAGTVEKVQMDCCLHHWLPLTCQRDTMDGTTRAKYMQKAYLENEEEISEARRCSWISYKMWL